MEKFFLPSEISRLVLGYIEEQNCPAAAQLFLDSCPHLRECAEAAQRGRHFSTRVSGKNLTDILDEFCLTYTLVQDRIQKLPENVASQIRNSCGASLSEQVKHLLDGKLTSQRFHVNITVPTQVGVSPSSVTTPGGLNSSHHGQRSKSRIRRANHQIQEQRLMLRSQDPLEDVTASVTVQRIEATQLENLPGSSTVDKECFSSRRNIFSTDGEKNHASRTSETAKTDLEEENLSLIDPKTGELIPRLSDASCSIPTLNVNETSITKEVNVQHSSLNNAIVSSFVGQNPATKVHFETPSAVEKPCSANAVGRSSLENFVMDILSTHDTSDNSQFQNKEIGCAFSQPSESKLERPNIDSEVHTNKEDAILGEGHHRKVPGSSENLGNLPSGIHSTPGPKDPQKIIHETFLQTPKRSGAKRKTKPTPLKLITPTKHKTGCDSSDSGEVMVDPKLFFGPLLDNRQLHEKIAENINQVICSSGSEAASEVKEMNTPEAVLISPAVTVSTSTSGEIVMHQELEKAIKTVVDKTEADPLFERLLNEILGPEYDDDCSSIVMPTSPEDKSSQVESFVGEQDTNIAKSSISGESEKKDPLSLLQDQNEAAIKSILEAQPENEDMPKKGKTLLTRGGLCKNRGFSRNHSVKIVRGRPSGACNPIFAEPEIIGDGKAVGRGKDEEEGAVTSTPIENKQAGGNEIKKLIILPVADLEAQQITYPTIVLNGVSQFIVPLASNQSFNPKYKLIAPKDKIEGTPGNPTILHNAPPEEIKGIVCKPTIGSIGTSESTSLSNPIGKIGLASTVLHGSTSISEQHHIGCITPISNQGLPSLLESDAEIGNNINKAILPQTVQENLDKNNLQTVECRSQLSLRASDQNVNSGKDATPNVISSRVTRAATESRLPILDKAPRVTPQMAAGNRRASLSTPRRNRASGHVRALYFGNTPPKPAGAENSPTEKLTDNICEGVSSVPKNENVVKQRKRPVPTKKMRKELQNTMDMSEKSPDPTVCIATRSPPPRLSGAWNKVGVDLIFGDSTSPVKPSQSPTLRSSLLLENEVPIKDQEASHKENNRAGNLFKWDSPKLRIKSTWDADLRAIISSSQERPTLTKKQQKSIEKKAKVLQKATETSSKKNARNLKEISKDESEEIGKLSAKGRHQKSKEETDRTKGKKLNKSKEEDDKEENEVNSDVENPTIDGERESEQLPAKGKRKQRSAGSGGAKKKGVRGKKLGEKSSATIETDVSPVSPEKVWVVQQSPGSWANKRSLHESILNLTATDSEMGKMMIGAARRRLDLQETPRKPESPDIGKGGIHANDLVQKHLLTCDRSALTVVETPLFPTTPNINGMSTPIGQDSSEVVETFPSYFKPRDKESSADPGRDTVSQTNGRDIKTVSQSKVSGSSCATNNSKDGNLVEEHDSSIGNIGHSGEVNNKPNDAEGVVSNYLTENMIVEEQEKKKQLPKTRTRKNARRSRVRKPAARRPPAGKRKNTADVKRYSKDTDGCIGNQLQESSLTDKDDELPQKRVLRPRKNKATYQEEPEEEKNKEGVYEKESLEEWTDCHPTTSRRRSTRASRASVEVPPPICDTVSVEEIEEGLVFEPLAQVDVNAQTQEAEVLAKAIALKLSPMNPKQDTLEEEEESDEDTFNVSGPIIRNQNQNTKNIRRIISSSSSTSSSNSSSSESSSSSSSSEDEVDEQRLDVDIARSSESLANANSTLNEYHDKIGKGVEEEKDDGKGVDISEGKESEEIKKRNIQKDGERTSGAEKSSKAKEASIREGRVVEIERVQESASKEPGKKVEVLHSPEFGIVGRRISVDDKKRRDNLEKILFGARNLGEEEEEAMDIDGKQASANVGLSLADRNLVNELELKRQRTLERLKGGKKGRKVCVGRRLTVKQSRCPPPSASMAAFLESSSKHLNISSESRCKNLENLEMRSVAQRKDKSFSDESTIHTQSVDEEDCLILRLSEGDDSEAKSPSTTIIPSPSKFDLLNSLEDRLAQLHGDTSPAIKKKTARMSCTPASIHLAEHTLEMDLSGPAEAVLVNNNSNSGKASELPKARCLEGENLQKLEVEPVPSTSKAADRLHKSAERKHAHQMGLVPNSYRESKVTFRNRNRSEDNELKSANGSASSRALRSNRSDVTNDVDSNILTGSAVPLSGEKERTSRSRKKTDNDNYSPVATRRSRSLSKISVAQHSELNEMATVKTDIVNKRRSSGSKALGNSQVTIEMEQNSLANVSCDIKDLEASCETLVQNTSVEVRSGSANLSEDKCTAGYSSVRNDALNLDRDNIVVDSESCAATSEKTKTFGANRAQDDENVSEGFSLALSDSSVEDDRATRSSVTMQPVIGETVEVGESDALCKRREKGKHQKFSLACSSNQSEKSLLGISKSNRAEISEDGIEEEMVFANLCNKNGEEKSSKPQLSDSMEKTTLYDFRLSNSDKDGEKSDVGKTNELVGACVSRVFSSRTVEVNKKRAYVSDEEKIDSVEARNGTTCVGKISCRQELGDSKIQMETSSESNRVRRQSPNPISNNCEQLADCSLERVGKMDETSEHLNNNEIFYKSSERILKSAQSQFLCLNEDVEGSGENVSSETSKRVCLEMPDAKFGQGRISNEMEEDDENNTIPRKERSPLGISPEEKAKATDDSRKDCRANGGTPSMHSFKSNLKSADLYEKDEPSLEFGGKDGNSRKNLLNEEDGSFSSSEFYISVMYDEGKSPKHSQHQVLFSPPESHDVSIELEEGVVKLTASKFLELFSFIAVEKPNDCKDKGDRNTISLFDRNQKVTSTPKVLSKDKTKEVDGRTRKGSAISESRKRKCEDMCVSSHDRSSAVKSSKSASNCSNLSRSSFSKVRNVTNEELTVKRIADVFNNVAKSDSENVDDDSLMTYAVIGCVDSEEAHAKEDEGAERFLPLKKRRTTTEEAPMKFQTDGDGANNNPGMFFQLNGMEIEDFLSKVHGDGS